MTPRRRDGTKAWSQWEFYVCACLGREERRRLAGKPTLKPEQKRRLRRRVALTNVGTLLVIAMITAPVIAAGHRVQRAFLVSAILMGGAMVVVAGVLRVAGNGRLLMRLRRERVAVVKQLAHEGSVRTAMAEVSSRRAAAAKQLAQSEGCLRTYMLARAHPTSIWLCVTGGYVYSSSFIFDAQWVPGLPGWTLPLSVAFGVGLMILGLRRLRTERRRLVAAAQGAVCPDCGFPLGNVRPAEIAAPDLAAQVGPVVCPECGCLWPLIAPELPKASGSG